jgi:hypothetical protein
VVAGLVAGQWLVTAALAWRAQHNGWVYFQGGDQIWYASSAGLLGRLELPPALVGGGWPLVLAPITWLTGPTFLQALPAVVLLDVIFLAPLALLAVYGIASQIAGRYFGYWCAALWVIAPVAAIPLFVDRYHERYVDQFLPQALGLTAMADFPSMVLLLGAAYFVLRSAREAEVPTAVIAGVLAGYAAWTKPPNLLFLVGAVAAYLVARRRPELLAFGAAVIPSLLTLALWKYRGLGSLPVLAYDEVRTAAGPLGFSEDSLDRYLKLDWDHWGSQMAQLREYFWSARLAQWAPFAGAIALLRVAPVAAALVVGWIGSFLFVKGTSPLASIETGTFFRLLMPAWPAYLLLLAAVPLLVPGAARKLAGYGGAPRGWTMGRRGAIGAVAVLAVVPLLVVSAARPIDGPERAVIQVLPTTELLTPVLPGLTVTIEKRGASRIIRWERGDWRSEVFFRLYRTAGAGEDVECVDAGAARCLLTMLVLGTTRGTSMIDGSPPPGVRYRLGIAANSIDDPAHGDVFGLGPPVDDG